jgi:hypothetical protein
MVARGANTGHDEHHRKHARYRREQEGCRQRYRCVGQRQKRNQPAQHRAAVIHRPVEAECAAALFHSGGLRDDRIPRRFRGREHLLVV